jgi:hypothetical protein
MTVGFLGRAMPVAGMFFPFAEFASATEFLLHMLCIVVVRRDFSQLSGHNAFLYFIADQPLNIIETAHIIGCNESDRFAFRFGPRCSSHAVNIIFRIARNIVIDHERNIFNINTA